MHFLVTDNADFLGFVVVGAMGILGVLGLIDVIINDILPDEYAFVWGLENRHYIYMVMAMFQGAELFIAAKLLDSWVLAGWCGVNIIFLIVTAFRDVTLRYKKENRCASN